MRVRHRLSRTKWLPVQRKRRRSHDIGINSKRNGLRSWRVELVTRTSAFIHYVILLHKYIELPILYKYFGIFYCESEIKYMYSENVYSKIMSEGQKRPQNSSDCSLCNLDFKNFRGRTLGPPFRCRLALLGSRYRPRNIYLLPHIQGGRSTALCLFLFGTSGYVITKLAAVITKLAASSVCNRSLNLHGM